MLTNGIKSRSHLLILKPMNKRFLTKTSKTVQCEKERTFNEWCWHNWMSTCRRTKIDPCLSPCTELKSKCIKDLIINLTTLNLIEEKVGSSLQDMVTGDHILGRIPVAQTIRATVNEWTSWTWISSVHQRTLLLRQKVNLLTGKISSTTPHQTKVWSPKCAKN